MVASRPAALIICGTPRSGSTMLCRMLAATGRAGNPHSYFRQQSIANWAARWNIPTAGGMETVAFDRAYLAAMQAAARRGEVFGLRLMWPSLGDARTRLSRATAPQPTVAKLFETAFGPPVFLHLSRRDKLAQAVSLVRAEQTGLWHLGANGEVLEGSTAPAEPRFDAAGVAALLQELVEHDRHWLDFFAEEAIDPLPLVYEDFVATPQDGLRAVLARLGVDPEIAAEIAVPTRRMADGVSAEWTARFRALGNTTGA